MKRTMILVAMAICTTAFAGTAIHELAPVKDDRTVLASPNPVVAYRAAPEGFPGAVLVTADADGAPHDMIKFFQMIARGGLTPDGRRLISAPLMAKWAAKQTPACVKVGYSFGMKVDGKGALSHGGVGGTWAEVNVKTRKARLYMVNMEGTSKVAKAFRDGWMKKTKLSASVAPPKR